MVEENSEFSGGDRVQEEARGYTTHKVDPRPGGYGNPLYSSNARSYVVAIFGGGLHPAIEVYILKRCYDLLYLCLYLFVYQVFPKYYLFIIIMYFWFDFAIL